MPRNRTLACVFAHPDDDAYGSAGSVALHADETDFRFVLIHATFGEQGEIRDGLGATRETLGSIRRAEDEAAWRAHGRAPDRHEWLGLPDGGVADVPFDDVVAAVARILEEEDPAVVVTFGPDGIFGHPDHIAIGAATDEAFARLRSKDGSGFQRLAHGAVPQSVFERWNRQRARHAGVVRDRVARARAGCTDADGPLRRRRLTELCLAHIADQRLRLSQGVAHSATVDP